MDRYAVRRALPDDEQAVDAFLDRSQHVALRVARAHAFAAVLGDLWLVEGGQGLVGACGIDVAPATVAQIVVCALADGCDPDQVMEALLLPLRRQLYVRGVQTLAYIGLAEWLLERLVESGFERTNTIMAMQKPDWGVPDWGNQSVTVRPAIESDVESVLGIDESVFIPLWRNTVMNLAEWLADSFFVVADREGEVVGYECLMMVGRHAHLSRVAVHPDHQGQRIGVRLLAEAVAYCRKQGAYGMTLNTQRDNWRSRRLYEWFGFKVLGVEAQVMVTRIS
jgi:ribosomal-protein-alanine N-acetyltransferase